MHWSNQGLCFSYGGACLKWHGGIRSSAGRRRGTASVGKSLRSVPSSGRLARWCHMYLSLSPEAARLSLGHLRCWPCWGKTEDVGTCREPLTSAPQLVQRATPTTGDHAPCLLDAFAGSKSTIFDGGTRGSYSVRSGILSSEIKTWNRGLTRLEVGVWVAV